MALIPLVGAVYAQLIVAGVFCPGHRHHDALAATLRPASRSVACRSARRPKPHAGQAQFAQIAMIIEAVMLGYSMSKRR